MFSYIFKGKINVLGKEIYCKVTGDIDSENDGQPYVLCITGGPGFSHIMTERTLKHFIPMAEQEQAALPHFILFDNLGCGESEPAADPDNEYTIDFFTDIAATLVEELQKKLNLDQIHLCVEGGSFGSLVAMNMPMRKPEWLDENSSIRLMQIMSRVGPNGSGMQNYTMQYLEENCSTHPNYEKMVAAQNKLFSGSIQDSTDYLQNFVLPMATLYTGGQSYAFSLIETNPEIFSSLLDWMDWLCKMTGYTIETIERYNLMINHCSLPVLNHFFKNDFNGFNLIKIIECNRELYSKIPLCLMVAENDHIVDPNTAKTIQGLLPDTSSIIVFNGAHMISQGPNQAIQDRLMYAFFIEHCIEKKDVNYDALNSIIPGGFSEKLEEVKEAIHESRIVFNY